MKINLTYYSLRRALVIVAIPVSMIQSGCKKLIDAELPIDKNTAVTVYNSTPTATAALLGIYTDLRGWSYMSNTLTIIPGKLSDELSQPGWADNYYLNNVFITEDLIWNTSYRYLLYRLNSLIEGVSLSTGIVSTHKNILLGEAKFLRALVYFNLVNYYGDVPLTLITDYKQNATIARSPKEEVFEQIIKDLTEAQNTLRDDFLGTDLNSITIERVRPNKAAATALLARVYLYTSQWQKAEEEASKVIADNRYQLLSDLNEVFLKNSAEAIWQLQPEKEESGNTNTGDGRLFIPYPGDMPSLVLNSFLKDAFEDDDLRMDKWVTTIMYNGTPYQIPFKYKIGNNTSTTPQEQTEYQMALRLAEQYLIRAEARAQLNKLTGLNSAQSDLNVIRNRAGLLNTTASTQSDILEAILQERQVELFTEGHRWLDLKRTGMIDEVMGEVTPAKGGTWASFKALMPIPADEFKYNQSLQGHQNPGYPEQ